LDSKDWDARYAGSELVWSAGPNLWVEQVCAGLPAGTAADLGAGEGRNALWLAAHGWDTTAVDFSGVALERARALAAERLGDGAGRFRTEQADLTVWAPEQTYNLVLVVYIQLPAAQRAAVLRAAAAATAPGGRLVVVAHHSDNLTEGVGGPQSPEVLYTEGDVVDDVGAVAGLSVERSERALRPVPGDGDRHAVDALVVLRRD
jgi:SAM-dependent methyltransferase